MQDSRTIYLFNDYIKENIINHKEKITNVCTDNYSILRKSQSVFCEYIYNALQTVSSVPEVT